MRGKPVLPEERIIAHLGKAYGIAVARMDFLPIGADTRTAVYHVETEESGPYFLKIRTEIFEETSVVIPQFLHEQGIVQIIPPLKTKGGQLWTSLNAYHCILYPFVEGHNGFKLVLSDAQWVDFGTALKSIHSVVLPLDLQGLIPFETYTAHWREQVKGFQALVESESFDDPVAAKMAALMRAHRDEIRLLVERAEQLASTLQSQPLKPVLCHSDIHAGNLLLSSNGPVYIVDWDNVILAPKERDLMFIGGGVGDNIWNSAREDTLFYQGYGATELNLTALTYYRCERIVQDVAAYCEEILVNLAGSENRQQGYQFFASQFQPNGVIEIAFQTDQKLKGS